MPEHMSDRLSDEELLHRARHLEEVSRNLFMAIWRQIIMEEIPERGPVADIALELRAVLNPHWPSNSDWLPEPLATERKEGYPGLSY